jgi:hypothetical protein
MADRKRKLDLGDIASKMPKGSDDAINRWTGRPYSARYYSIFETRQKLPVYQFKEELIETVKNNQFVVVEGETGSGAFLNEAEEVHRTCRVVNPLLTFVSHLVSTHR